MKKNLAQSVCFATVGIFAVALAFAGCRSPEPSTSPSPAATDAPVGLDEVFASLNTSVNVGALAGHPYEGAWGDGPLTEELFDWLVDSGFTAVRLGVRFSGYQDAIAPYTIDLEYLDRVEWAVDEMTERGLTVVVSNVFSVGSGATPDTELLFTDPASLHDRFLAVWEQVAPLLADRDGRVVFEILNEPNSDLSEVWNEYQAEALAVIRETNPTRPVILTPGQWSQASELDRLVLPDDPNIIVTIHHYAPMSFTHQGAPFLDPVFPTGVEWPGENLELAHPWWSWESDATTTWTADGLDVAFSASWGIVAFHNGSGVSEPVSISFTVDEDVELVVHCASGDQASPHPARVTAHAGEAMTIPVADCDGGTVDPDRPMTHLWLQNTDAPSASFTVTDLGVASALGDVPLLIDPMEQVCEPVRTAADYGRRHGLPVFLGEFGTYAGAPLDSRVRWTLAVRTCARENDMATGLWGFVGDFGIIDPATGAPYPDLLDAATHEP
ncbi:MAG: cellulase family glycosylhydrolase [Demequinaceae bacterium]|nr:cellulase family glycosylhydrolase [Demequinaceae bacterium]